jgi:heme/copper-type cytochrome/quinol oxidase subunit 2
MTIAHTVAFTPLTTYTVTIAVTATDRSAPGNGIATAYTWSFTVPKPAPSAPGNLRLDGDTTDKTIPLRWDPVTTYTDGSTLLPADLSGYYVYRAATCSAQESTWTNLTSGGVVTVPTFTDGNLAAATNYCYWVKAVTTDGRVSAVSNSLPAVTKNAVSDMTWLWILLIIVIVAVVVGLILWSRRKKPEAAPPTPEEPAAEVPAEEPTPPEEGGEAGPEAGGETGGEGGPETGGETP